jgi:hypothetical protein
MRYEDCSFFADGVGDLVRSVRIQSNLMPVDKNFICVDIYFFPSLSAANSWSIETAPRCALIHEPHCQCDINNLLNSLEHDLSTEHSNKQVLVLNIQVIDIIVS